MNKRSFIDLTALLDVVLILLFAALLNMAGKTELANQRFDAASDELKDARKLIDKVESDNEDLKEELENLNNELGEKELELASLYGSDVKDVDHYKDILSRISVITVTLKGEDNELFVQGNSTGINILKESLATSSREESLEKSLKTAIEDAIRNRSKSDILFIRLELADDDVYKYAYDYLVGIIYEIIDDYGEDKVMLSREY